eukprot:GHRQ01004305.1.p1 GENE.GHRQ01004305.1~~GHRQ01004305.1.p1  ORF type:complete len:110 (-),score=15.65 GHRQ01004305.1:150-479(-)
MVSKGCPTMMRATPPLTPGRMSSTRLCTCGVCSTSMRVSFMTWAVAGMVACCVDEPRSCCALGYFLAGGDGSKFAGEDQVEILALWQSAPTVAQLHYRPSELLQLSAKE